MYKRKIFLKFKLLSVIFSTLLISNVAASAVTAKDIDEIAKVCMYSETALQDFILVGMGVDYGNPREDLKNKLLTIDEFLTDVSKHDMSKKSHDNVAKLKLSWGKIQPIFSQSSTKKSIISLRNKVDKFAIHCEELDEQLANEMHSDVAHETVLIADLGVDVQRLTVLYLMKAWGIEVASYYQEIDNLLKDFEKRHKELVSSSDSLVPKNIKEKLHLIKKHFLVFKFMASSKSGRFVPTLAQKNSNKIMQEILEVLALEEALIK